MTSAPAWFDEAKDRVVEFEGEVRNKAGRHVPYTCPSGALTLGHGHNLANGISDAVADLMLEEDMAEAVDDLDQHIPWWRDLPDQAQIVLFDLAFNMGWANGNGGGLSSFRSFLPAMRDQQFELAANLLLRSLYARQVGRRAKANADLLRRAAGGE